MGKENRKLITENTVLNAYGNYSSYDSYNYCNNSSASWEKEIPLKIGEIIEGSGFKIEIAEVTDNDILLNVYKSEYNKELKDYEYVFKYEHKISDMNDVYIEKYSETSGSVSNDNVCSTSSEVVVRLKESDILKITKLSEKIDSNIKKISSLVEKDSYFEVVKKLEILRFRATDENYGNRIIALNNEKAISEKNQILEQLDFINEIINDIKLYNQYNIEFIKRFPFELTNAQQRSISECLKDMQTGFSMNRLLQGDVGSGKTAVAQAAATLALWR